MESNVKDVVELKQKDRSFIVDFNICGRCVILSSCRKDAERVFINTIKKRLCNSTNLTLMETGKIFGVKVDSVDIEAISD